MPKPDMIGRVIPVAAWPARGVGTLTGDGRNGVLAVTRRNDGRPRCYKCGAKQGSAGRPLRRDGDRWVCDICDGSFYRRAVDALEEMTEDELAKAPRERRSTWNAVLAYVRDHPGVTTRAVRDALGLRGSAVEGVLGRMLAAGKVRRSWARDQETRRFAYHWEST